MSSTPTPPSSPPSSRRQTVGAVMLAILAAYLAVQAFIADFTAVFTAIGILGVLSIMSAGLGVGWLCWLFNEGSLGALFDLRQTSAGLWANRLVPIASFSLALMLMFIGSGDPAGGTSAAPVPSVPEPAQASDGRDLTVALSSSATAVRIAQAGTVRVGVRDDVPGFGSRAPNGTLNGFDVEIAKIISDALGIDVPQIDLIPVRLMDREQALAEGTLDLVIATYTINDARRKRVSFAGPYLLAGQDLLVKRENTLISGPESLRPTGARVCAIESSTSAKIMERYIDREKLVLLDSYGSCADVLLSGQVDVVASDTPALTGLAVLDPIAFKLVGNRFTVEPYGIGITRGDFDFCRFINDALVGAASDGRYRIAWASTAGKVDTRTRSLPPAEPCT